MLFTITKEKYNTGVLTTVCAATCMHIPLVLVACVPLYPPPSGTTGWRSLLLKFVLDYLQLFTLVFTISEPWVFDSKNV